MKSSARITFDDLPVEVQSRAIGLIETMVLMGKQFLDGLSPEEKIMFEDAIQNVGMRMVTAGMGAYMNPLVDTNQALAKVASDMSKKSPFIQRLLSRVLNDT